MKSMGARLPRSLLATFGLALMLWAGLARGEQEETPWVERVDGEVAVHLYFFWSARCPHCLEARPFIQSLPRQHPWIRLHDLEITASRDHLRLYLDMAGRLGEEARSVPALLFCGQMRVGWGDAASSGAELLAALEQ